MSSAWKRPMIVSGKIRTEGPAPTPPGPKIRPRGAAPRPSPTRILFINQYYWPDHASTAQHLTDLAESLAREGHDCHVLCGRGKYKPGEAPSPRREAHEGVTIHRVPATSFGRKRTIGRMVDYLSFYARAACLALFLPRPDVVVTLTTPPLIGLVGTLLRRLKGCQHVYWSMDLHPDASIALGKMSPKNPIVRLLAGLSDLIYRQADRVVALGPYMADRVESKGVRTSRIEEIAVWSRRDEIGPIDRGSNRLRASLGLGDEFVVMYSGNLGMAHSADEFIEAARRLRDRSDIVFLFVGDGPRLGAVREAAKADRLRNVRFHDYFPRSDLRESISVGDAHLISMRREMVGVVVPCKLYGAMAAGRPALFVGPDHCETADTIRDNRCGLTIRLGDVDGLVAAIETLAADRRGLEEMGAAGREAFLSQFEREACCASWARLVEQLGGTGVGVTRPSALLGRTA